MKKNMKLFGQLSIFLAVGIFSFVMISRGDRDVTHARSIERGTRSLASGECYFGFCQYEKVYTDKYGDVIIQEIFPNGMARIGDPGFYMSVNDFSHAAKCLGEICVHSKVYTDKYGAVVIQDLYANGMARIGDPGFWINIRNLSANQK